MSERCNNAFDNDPERAREAGKKSKRKPFDQRMREWLEKAVEESPDKTREDLLRIRLYELAINGDRQAINDIFNRAYGQPKQFVENSGEVKTPIWDNIKDLIKVDKKEDK